MHTMSIVAKVENLNFSELSSQLELVRMVNKQLRSYNGTNELKTVDGVAIAASLKRNST
jgi:hypothetical protein